MKVFGASFDEFQENQPLFCDVHVFPKIRDLRNKI